MIRKQSIKKTGLTKVTFVLPADHPHAESSVVGDFNNWDRSANPLRKRSNGTHSASVDLEPNGRYAFRYVYGDDRWFNDEDADAYEVGGFGSENGVVLT